MTILKGGPADGKDCGHLPSEMTTINVPAAHPVPDVSYRRRLKWWHLWRTTFNLSQPDDWIVHRYDAVTGEHLGPFDRPWRTRPPWLN